VQSFVEAQVVVVEGYISPFRRGKKTGFSIVTSRYNLRGVNNKKSGNFRKVTHDSASVKSQYVFSPRVLELLRPLQLHKPPSSTNVS
jgi:hypothetical protein